MCACSSVAAYRKGLRVMYHDLSNQDEIEIFHNFTSKIYTSLTSYLAITYFVPEKHESEYSGLVILFPSKIKDPTVDVGYFESWRLCALSFINDSLLHHRIHSPFVAYIAADWSIPHHKIGGLPTLTYSRFINGSEIAMPW